jgi:hypothetical protein
MAAPAPAADAGAYWLRPGKAMAGSRAAESVLGFGGGAMAASSKVQKRAVDSLFMRSGPVDFRE